MRAPCWRVPVSCNLAPSLATMPADVHRARIMSAPAGRSVHARAMLGAYFKILMADWPLMSCVSACRQHEADKSSA